MNQPDDANDLRGFWLRQLFSPTFIGFLRNR